MLQLPQNKKLQQKIQEYFAGVLVMLTMTFILRILLFIFIIEPLYSPHFYYLSILGTNGEIIPLSISSSTSLIKKEGTVLELQTESFHGGGNSLINTVGSSSVKTWNQILSMQSKNGVNLFDDYASKDGTEMCSAAYQKVCSIYEYDLEHHIKTLNQSEQMLMKDDPILLSSGTFKDITKSIETTKTNILLNLHNGEPLQLCVDFFHSMLTDSSSMSFLTDEIYNFYRNYINEFNIKTLYDILLHTNAHSLLVIEHRVKRIFKSEYIIDLDLNVNLINNILLPLLNSFNSSNDPDFYNFVFDGIYDLMKTFLIPFNGEEEFKMMFNPSMTKVKFTEKDCLEDNDAVESSFNCFYYLTIKDLELQNYDCLVKKMREYWNVSDNDLISFNNYEIKLFENMFCSPLSLNTTILLLGLDYIVPFYSLKNRGGGELGGIGGGGVIRLQQKQSSLIKKQQLILEKTKLTFNNVYTMGHLVQKFKTKFLNTENHFTFHSKTSSILKGLLNFSEDSEDFRKSMIMKKCKKTVRELFHNSFNYRYMDLSVTSNNQCKNVFELIQKYIDASQSFFTSGTLKFNEVGAESSLFTKAEIEDISLKKKTKIEDIEEDKKFHLYLQEKMKHLMIIVLNCVNHDFALKSAKEEYMLKDDLNVSAITLKKTKWLVFLHLHRFNWMDRLIDQFIKTTHRYDYLPERIAHRRLTFSSSSNFPIENQEGKGGRGEGGRSKLLEWIWSMTEVEIVNAWYTPTMNMITIPIGIVEYPLFRNDPIYDESLLGNIIGHEIGHASDHHGLLFDKNGDFTNRFESRKNDAETCLVNDFPHKICDYTDYGNHTLGENMADQFGLRMTLLIFYQRILKEYNFIQNENNLEGGRGGIEVIELYKHRKSILQKELFVNFIKIWCGRTTLKQECNLVNNDVHALARHRVTNTLRNFKTYKQLFECEDTDSLVNPKPCLIY